MARIFVGDSHKIEQYPEIIEAIRGLDDDTWVVLEVKIGSRDVDCLIIRPNDEPGKTATVLVSEFKQINAPIWGGWTTEWTVDRNGQKETLQMSNSRDINPIQQAVNACHEVNQWLADHYTSYKAFGNHLLDGQRTKGYPFLLITSRDASIRHTIDRPERSFGNVYFTVGAWVQKVRDWTTDKSFPLTHDEIAKLVALLPVRPLEAPAAPNGEVTPLAAPEEPVASDAAEHRQEPDGVPIERLRWLGGLQQWVMEIETRISTLEAAVVQMGRSKPVVNPVVRDLTEEEVTALRNAVQDISRVAGRRDFPTVVKNLNHHLGYDLVASRYNGFEKARFFFDQAVSQGVIQYGPFAGPTPTIYLTQERVPIR